jgi:hypothetical protein
MAGVKSDSPIIVPAPLPALFPRSLPPLHSVRKARFVTEGLGSPGLRRPRALESQRESKGICGPLLFASQGMTTMVRPMAVPAAGAMSHRTERAIEVHTPAFATIPWECPPGVVRKCAVSLVDAAASANMSRSCRSQSAGRHRDRACWPSRQRDGRDLRPPSPRNVRCTLQRSPTAVCQP